MTNSPIYGIICPNLRGIGDTIMNNEEKMKKILSKYDGHIGDVKDLIGDDEPSKLFYFLADKLSYLLDDNPENVLSKKGVERRRIINKIIKAVGPSLLSSKQIMEDRNKLKNSESTEIDKGITLPDEPVIWAPNHGFKDDALATVLAAYRNAYFLFGSLPQFYNTIDGITAWLNGSILVNRKNKASKQSSVAKCEKAIDLGADLIIYPEGVWNKSSNLLSLKLWPGIYRIAKEKNIKIVPIIHYKKELQLKEKNDYIHTVIDDPIDISNMGEKEALEYLRDIYAYWLYLMMEKYGQTTRKEELEGFNNSTEVWETRLKERLATADRYDREIEIKANYVEKEELELLQAWKDIANIKNITPNNIALVNDAKRKVKELEESDFQRRF